MTSPPKPWPPWLVALCVIFGSAFSLGCALLIYIAPQWTATARSSRVAVWLMTPHVAPGDVAIIDVDVQGGERAGIRAIGAWGSGVHERRVFEGATWGSAITTRSSSIGRANEELEIHVPDAANPGDTLDLTVEVSYTLAVSSGRTFSDVDGSHKLKLPVEVRSPAERTLRRLFSAILPLALLGAVLSLLRRWWHPLIDLLKSKPGTKGAQILSTFGMFAIGGIVLWGFFGWAVFALSLVAATGWTSDVFEIAMTGVWLLGAPLAAWKLAGPRPAPPLLGALRAVEVERERPYREGPPAPRKAPSLKKLAKALREACRVDVKVREGTLTARRSPRGRPLTVRVVDPRRVRPEDVAIESGDSLLTMEACNAWAPLLGPVELELGGVTVFIDGARGVADIEKEWSARASERLEALHRELLERLGRKGGGLA